MKRQIQSVGQFFNDGYWYVLGSTCLGGSGLTAAQIAETLQGGVAQIRPLLESGACLPVFFPGDCAMDDALILAGDLTEREEQAWIARMRGRLELPCGEFLLMGGAMEEDFESAMSHFEAPDPHYVNFVKMKVAPGSYLVEIYAFLSSMTVNFLLEEDEAFAEEPIDAWWARTRPGEAAPDWMEEAVSDGYVEQEEGMLDYIIRLVPASDEIPLPPQDEEYGWCGQFEVRKPAVCPDILLQADSLGES